MAVLCLQFFHVRGCGRGLSHIACRPQPYLTPPAAFRSRVGCAINTEDGKEVPSMNEDKKEFETVDITGLTDEELDNVVGGGETHT